MAVLFRLVSLVVDEGLLHFQYKDLESNTLLEDLILFPGDATFSPIPSANRVYVLRFTSSSARHFYWMQDVENTQDSRRASRVNALIDDPDAQGSAADDASADSAMEGVSSAAPPPPTQPATGSSATTTSSVPTPAPAPSQSLPPGVTASQFAQLQALLSQSGSTSSSATNSLQPTVSLSDILSPSRLLSLLSSSPSLASSLYSYLPSDSSTVPLTLESLQRVVSSPELRKSARSLDQALTTGALGPLAGSLGLREEETFGVENYLKGVQRLGDEEKQKEGGGNGGDSMQTD